MILEATGDDRLGYSLVCMGDVAMTRYEIRIAHALDEEVSRAFDGLVITPKGDVTVLTGDLDQAALHGLLERIRSLGYDLIDALRVRRPTARGME